MFYLLTVERVVPPLVKRTLQCFYRTRSVPVMIHQKYKSVYVVYPNRKPPPLSQPIQPIVLLQSRGIVPYFQLYRHPEKVIVVLQNHNVRCSGLQAQQIPLRHYCSIKFIRLRSDHYLVRRVEK